jgi:hypothetical protein
LSTDVSEVRTASTFILHGSTSQKTILNIFLIFVQRTREKLEILIPMGLVLFSDLYAQDEVSRQSDISQQPQTVRGN